MEEVINLFENYVQKFDLSDFDLKRKYDHSYRVMKLSEEIAESLNLSADEILLAKVIGLLHDIGRFHQLEVTKSYYDSKFDHADYGVQYLRESGLLKQANLPKEWHSIILTAIQFHNKFMITKDLYEQTLLFSKIIRDADKIDIMKLSCNMNQKKLGSLHQRVIDEFYENHSIHVTSNLSFADFVLVRLAFLYDLNFKKSFLLVKEMNWLETYYHSLGDCKQLLPYFEWIQKYLDKKIKEDSYVRYKI